MHLTPPDATPQSRPPSHKNPPRFGGSVTRMTILAIDVGTTGVTALLISTEATIVAKGYREFPQHFPQEGWVEHEPSGSGTPPSTPASRC